MKKIIFDIPVFPLDGAILMPKANLPLNIFEQRYISMVDYALSNNKIIGMIQSVENSKKLFGIGSFGKITSFNKTNDGRYIINLLGARLFKTNKELKTSKKFRIFNVKCKNFNKKEWQSKKNDSEKLLLISKFKIFIKKYNPSINFPSIEKIKFEELVKVMAMICPFAVSEKQMLLESETIHILEYNLLTLFDFYSSDYNNDVSIN